jgi:hypothetical protein
MAHCTVRSGDTLWAIAERCYGDGQFWSYLADNNPMTRSGVLYEGQRLEVPRLSKLPSLADARRHALPLGHAPVKLILEGKSPLFRYDGFGGFGVGWLVGELVFHRHGRLHLGELTDSNLLRYRLEQIAWAKALFVELCIQRTVDGAGVFPAGYGAHHAYLHKGPGYTITGGIQFWEKSHSIDGSNQGWCCGQMRMAMDPGSLFDTATLVLGELPTPPGAPQEKVVPLGRVVRAACPHLVSPATLWTLTRDRTLFPQSQTMYLQPDLELDGAEPAPAPPSPPKRKKSLRAPGGKKPAKTRATSKATSRKSRLRKSAAR